MQLYRIDYTSSPASPRECAWAGSQTDAAKTRARLRSTRFTVLDTKTVDVPTVKGALIEWLNVNAKDAP